MGGFRVLDNLQAPGGEPLHETASANIVDNPITAGQHEKDRNAELPPATTKEAVEPNTCDQEPCGRFPQRQRIVLNELLPPGRIGEQFGIVQGNRKPPPRGQRSGNRNLQLLAERRMDAGTKPGTEEYQSVNETGASKLERRR